MGIMIYVEEKSFSRQIELLKFMAVNHEFQICAWLYPESEIEVLAGFEVLSEKADIKPVTTYENGVVPKHTKLVSATTETISAFCSAQKDVKANCDSLAIYPFETNNWVCATIGHEGMCLVTDKEMLQGLLGQGFNASAKAPSWW